jgi:hypothetical protein
MMDEKSKGEEAKRKYLASVTNPDRFNTFSTYKKQQPTEIEGNDNNYDENVLEQPPSKETSEVSENSSDITSGSDFAEMKRQIAEDRALLNPLTDKSESSAARVAVESILNMINSNNDKKTESTETNIDSDATQFSKSTTTSDLAARLGQAAEEQEKRDAEARIALDKKREEQKQQLLEIQMRREEEARIKEIERVEKARRIAEEERRKKSEKENAEKAAMAARQAMQDEYWAKMLEKERVRKGGTKEPIEIKEKGSVVRDSQLKSEQDDEVRDDPLDNKKEAAPNVETILSAARVSRPIPRRVKDEITESPFVREQRLKKEEIDRLRQVDMQSLKSLNSPIPSLSKVPPPPSPATYRAPPMPAPIREAKVQTIPVSSSPPSPAQQQPLITPAKRIVRQQAIIRDADDDDDDETFSRSSAPGLTVADALKNRRRDGDGGSTESGKTTLSAEDKAKQWGIDMSRFN